MTTFSLRDELGLATKWEINPQKKRFETYGVLENPFPPANKTTGNPRFASSIDTHITTHIRAFIQSKVSEVVVVTGTQGLGKTNLLEFYQRELSAVLQDDNGSYFIYYYSDPHPEFGSVVNRIFQELGENFLKKIAHATRSLSNEEKEASLKLVRTPDLRFAFGKMFLSRDNEQSLGELAKLLLEYLMGSRIYKRHIDDLKLQQRLDTTESKTQALRDVVYLSHHLKVFDGLFLFLDELEKAGSFTTQKTTAYLSAIRALIDTLPSNLFLMLAMTPDAHNRYSRDLPALGGRLQDVLELQPLSKEDEAVQLYEFYLHQARDESEKVAPVEWLQGKSALISEKSVRDIFIATLEESKQKGLRGGITPRDFLNALHDQARRTLNNLV